MTHDIDKVRSKLLRWFKENQRVLPWRNSGDPYKIWLSEIIMQQTRVAQGTPYYNRFVEKYPTVDKLAAADEQEVLKLWQGLGYYSRARNLHHAAKQVAVDYNGLFPSEYQDIIKLKGVGKYTAAAISSMAFNKPHAAVDGNVYRVLARLYNINTPVNAPGSASFFQNLADELLDKVKPGMFNEAMMEFGATVCLPRNPNCKECPLSSHCLSFKNKTQADLPVKISLKAPKTRHLNYLLLRHEDDFYLKNRESGDIWQGMYDLPMVEHQDKRIVTEEEIEYMIKTPVRFLKPVMNTVHKLTHQRLEIVFYEADIDKYPEGLKSNIVKTDAATFRKYPLPKPIELFLNDYLCNPKN